jgi:alginate O-acetyltransferase complex protein AlgI
MLFSDPTFFLFFVAYFPLHVLLPPRFRIYLIILGSAVFYSFWHPVYIVMPVALAAIAWAGASWLHSSQRHKRSRLVAVITVILLPLLIVKYSYFVANEVIQPFVNLRAWLDVEKLRFSLPLGISFITFTLIAYAVEAFRKDTARQSFRIVLGYVLFFPHLIAGPILRPRELMPQLAEPRAAMGARFKLGLGIFTLGLVKKLVFADQISSLVDRVYATPGGLSAWEHVLAIYGFAMQIYCDFSGYTDMAIGIALVLRIRLPGNFRQPYSSGSIIEFWRRWHITLSHWLRDYLYIPLGGNRGNGFMRFRNVIITMVLGGLWHGANWTFVLWGLFHGLAIALLHVLRPHMGRSTIALPAWISVVIAFHFVAFLWVLFRAPDAGTALRIFEGLFYGPWSNGVTVIHNHLFETALILTFLVTHRFDSHARVRLAMRRIPSSVIWPTVVACWFIAIAISQGSSAKFIYFDF